MKLKYSVCIDAVFMNKCSIGEVMEKVKAAGYQAIEFWSWWDKDIDEIADLQHKLGLEIAAFCTKFVNPGDISLQQEYLDGLKETIQVAKRLKCFTLIVQAGWEYDSFSKEITKKTAQGKSVGYHEKGRRKGGRRKCYISVRTFKCVDKSFGLSSF